MIFAAMENKVHEVTVQAKKDPEFRRHSKGNMLPGGFGKGIQAVFNPDKWLPFCRRKGKIWIYSYEDFSCSWNTLGR